MWLFRGFLQLGVSLFQFGIHHGVCWVSGVGLGLEFRVLGFGAACGKAGAVLQALIFAFGCVFCILWFWSFFVFLPLRLCVFLASASSVCAFLQGFFAFRGGGWEERSAQNPKLRQCKPKISNHLPQDPTAVQAQNPAPFKPNSPNRPDIPLQAQSPVPS